jgi:putative membrane protein
MIATAAPEPAMETDRFFSPADLETIRTAVQEAEARTSGEIVPYVVERSDEYSTAAWKGAALGALLGPAVALALHRWTDVWGWPLEIWIVLPALLGGAAGYLLALLPPVRRWMVGEPLLDARARRRAAAAFLEAEVFGTRERTGILLFVSLFERRVVLLADSGIHQKVEEKAWEEITQRLARGIREGRPGPAMVEAIRACGELLERHGVERRTDDRDELSNDLRRERD